MALHSWGRQATGISSYKRWLDFCSGWYKHKQDAYYGMRYLELLQFLSSMIGEVTVLQPSFSRSKVGSFASAEGTTGFQGCCLGSWVGFDQDIGVPRDTQATHLSVLPGQLAESPYKRSLTAREGNRHISRALASRNKPHP